MKEHFPLQANKTEVTRFDSKINSNDENAETRYNYGGLPRKVSVGWPTSSFSRVTFCL